MQPFLVTEVIDGDTFEVSPEIPPAVVLQTLIQRLRGEELPETESSLVVGASDVPSIQRLRGEELPETALQRPARPNVFKKVRLANIDAPESWTPQGEQQAAIYLKGLIEGKRVTLEPTGISHDLIVANVWRYPNHFFVNAAMVYRGFAQWARDVQTQQPYRLQQRLRWDIAGIPDEHNENSNG